MAQPFPGNLPFSESDKTPSFYTNEISKPVPSSASQGWPLRKSQRPPIDHRQSEYRQSKSFSQLIQLAQHPHRLAHLSIIMALLELDEKAWHCIQHLRKNESSADALRFALPQLYQIPEEIAGQLEDIREGSDWENVKGFAMKTIADGGFSLSSRPNSQRLSGWSPRSSTNSTTSTRSNLSHVSTNTSYSSPHPTSTTQQQALPSSPMEQVKDETMNLAGSPTSYTVSSPQSLTMKQERPFQCPLQGCRKEYKVEKWYNRHMKDEHPEYLLSESLHPHQVAVAPPFQVPYSEPSISQSYHAGEPPTQNPLSASNTKSLQPARRLVPLDRGTESTFSTSHLIGQNPYGQTGVNLMTTDVAFLGSGQLLPLGMYSNDDGCYGDTNMSEMGYDETAVHTSMFAAALEASHKASQVNTENDLGDDMMAGRR